VAVVSWRHPGRRTRRSVRFDFTLHRLNEKRNSVNYSPETRYIAVLPAGGNRDIRSFLDAAWPSPVQW